MTIQEAIAQIADRRDLSRAEAEEIMGSLMRGEGTPAQIGALLIALRMKGETVDEITAFASVMRQMATRIECSRTPLVDTCGTGGDRSGTFNISTTAAFVVAGSGIAVAKHGNRSATSLCGSADVLEELGVNLDLAPERVGQSIDEIGIGFLYARALHGAMKHVAGPRTELKTRSVFNFLGPLSNPAGATCQVVGIFDENRVEDLANVLTNLGTERSFVVNGADGLDEISISGPTTVAESRDGEVTTYQLDPGSVGLECAELSTLKGGDAAQNARILVGILEGNEGPPRDIVLFNAAAAILAADVADGWEEALLVARESIDSGQAKAKLDALVAFSNS